MKSGDPEKHRIKDKVVTARHLIERGTGLPTTVHPSSPSSPFLFLSGVQL